MILVVIVSILSLIPQAKPLEVIARIPQGTYVAGQAIEIRLGIVAEGERPEVTPPKIPPEKADLVLMERDFRQVGASGIGEMVSESNLYIERFLVIPRRPGPLDIPSFEARLGERRGASRPLRIEVQAVPTGRPATFLGGVGGVTLRAGIGAERIRVGEAVEYTLTLEGPGARGSRERPTLAQARSRNPTLEVLAPVDDLVQNPPARTFRWSLRPTQPGEYVMPPVLVSTYNSRTRQFDTRSSASVSFFAADVPRFDESTFRYGTSSAGLPVEEDREVEVFDAAAAVGGASLLGASTAIALARWIHRGRRPIEKARRIARQACVELPRIADDRLAAWTLGVIGTIIAQEPDGTGQGGTLDSRRIEMAIAAIGWPEEVGRLIRDVAGMCEEVFYGDRRVRAGMREQVQRMLASGSTAGAKGTGSPLRG